MPLTYNAKIMGVINVTPDSFSDGGRYDTTDAALQHAERLASDGADILDVGGESTRPGATPLSTAEEWQRLRPVLDGLAHRSLGCELSVDTRKPEIIERLLDYDVAYINNVEGVTAEAVLRKIAARPEIKYVAMHMPGTPQTMQRAPLDANAAIEAVEKFFASSTKQLLSAGLNSAQIVVDPGVGFGKTIGANLALLAKTPEWGQRYQLMVGVSRKSFIGKLLDIPVPQDRDAASKVLEAGLLMSGAQIIRTHDVKKLVQIRDALGEAGCFKQ